MHPAIPVLMSLFQGYDKAYGAYRVTGEVTPDGKVLGKAYSLMGDVNVELWIKHVDGTQGLGIIPINENSQVKFAAIDVDQYPIDHQALAIRLRDAKLPLKVCRTKSGGAHLYLFLTEFYSATAVQNKLREIAAFLGFGGSEIFPKQTKIIVDRGDVGQWINMPYFAGDETVRYCVDEKGPMQLTTFCAEVQRSLITPKQLENIQLVPAEVLLEGPPCLQRLCAEGFPAGTRNNGLFNLGVYARKAHQDGWQKFIEEANHRYMDPPLTTTEVLGVIKSLGKKEFGYMCEQPPIKTYCNKELCRTKQHGIGGCGPGFPKLGTLTKLCTEPPIWFVEVEGGGRMELSTDDLQNPIKFQHRCMEALNVMPTMPKKEIWTGLVQTLLQDVNIIDVPREATPVGQLVQHLEDFCTSRVQGKSHDELLLGKPWTSDGRTYFRMRDFLAYLERMKFREFSIAHIAMHLRDKGAEKHFFNVKGKGCNCYSIPEFTAAKQTEPLDPVPQDKKVPY